MITEDYCSQEVARLLKKKGFDERSRIKYCQISDNEIFAVENEQVTIDEVYIPTHQMAMKWLREMYNIVIVIEPHMYDYVNERNASYVCSIWVGDNYYENPTSTNYPTYEKTVDAALEHVLKNLI